MLISRMAGKIKPKIQIYAACSVDGVGHLPDNPLLYDMSELELPFQMTIKGRPLGEEVEPWMIAPYELAVALAGVEPLGNWSVMKIDAEETESDVSRMVWNGWAEMYR